MRSKLDELLSLMTGKDAVPVIKHVKFMAEKASQKMFAPIAYVKVKVRRVSQGTGNHEGIEQFGVILTEGV